MRVVYLVYSIAGWVAFGTLMAYRAGYVLGRRTARRRPLEGISPATVTDDRPAAPEPKS
jgi:hypothetical protein